MFRLATPLILVVAASAAGEETIWLRGRGSDVWIERDGEMREPRDNRKGLTIMSTPVQPAADRLDTRARVGGWSGAPVPIPDRVSQPPYPYGLDAPYLYGLGYLEQPGDWRGYDSFGRHRFGDRHFGRHRGHHRGGHHVGGDRHHRHRFGFDGRRRPEVHRSERAFGGHRDGGRGGFDWRGGHRGGHHRGR